MTNQSNYSIRITKRVTFGTRLKSLRKCYGLTQQALADLLCIDRSTYTYYELDTVRPSHEILVSLSLFYGVSLDYLFGLTDEANPHKMPLPICCNQIKKGRKNKSK